MGGGKEGDFSRNSIIRVSIRIGRVRLEKFILFAPEFILYRISRFYFFGGEGERVELETSTDKISDIVTVKTTRNTHFSFTK